MRKASQVINFDYYDLHDKLRPLARLTIENEDNEFKIPYLCLIDSGADETTSFVSIGKDLQINFEKCPKEIVGGIGSDICPNCKNKVPNKLIAYRKQINVIIEGYKEKISLDVLWLIKEFDPQTDFAFMMGRKTFFEKFDIIFQENKKKFNFKPI